jgi:hypothetical protein
VDLFGEETEEEKKAAEERAAAVKASGKKKESKFVLYHIHILIIILNLVRHQLIVLFSLDYILRWEIICVVGCQAMG